ncbi:MAG: dienelactone hydrolase family protein [Candidatus Omnitrophota bacterium]
MKKFSIILALSFILIAILFVSAFLYVDFSGHKGFIFDVYESEKPAGTVKIDKFVTEDKIIYKSHAEYPASLEYPVIDEKMYLKRKTMTLQKFREESKDVKGRKRLIWLFQKGEIIDFLFLEHPRVFSFQGFEVGDKTVVYSPYSSMLCMSIVDKYNFWKKGSQFFEIMVPIREPVLPMRTKVEMRDSHDTYVSIGGHKTEAEVFVLAAAGVPQAEIVLSKYSHEILEIELKGGKTKIILTNYLENPYKRIRFIVDRMIRILEEMARNRKPISEKLLYEDNKVTEGRGSLLPSAGVESSIEKKDVFFGNEETALSGKIWAPSNAGKYPGVILVPANAPTKRGEEKLINDMGKELARAGFVVLAFDFSAKGTVRTTLSGINDEAALKSITAAVSYFKEHSKVMKNNISLMGYKGGGYLALKESSANTSVSGCVLLGIPPGNSRIDICGSSTKEDMDKMLLLYDLGPFESVFSGVVIGIVTQYCNRIMSSGDGYSFFKGAKLPTGEYGDFLKRKPYEVISNYNKPLLFIYGRDDKRFDDKARGLIEELGKKKENKIKIAEIRTSGEYMGGKSEENGSDGFSVDKDISRLIISWLKERIPPDETEKEG